MKSTTPPLELVPLEAADVRTPAAGPAGADANPARASGAYGTAADPSSADLTIDYVDPAAPPSRKSVGPTVTPGTVGEAPGIPDIGPLDKFVAEAAKQYREGHIDRQLWTYSLAQAQGDKSTALTNYLRERAASLRRIDQELQIKARARAARVVRAPEDDAEPRGGPWPSKDDGRRRGIRQSKFFVPAVAGAALACIAGSAWLYFTLRTDEAATGPAAAAVARPAPPTATPAAKAPLKAPASANDGAVKKRMDQEFAAKVAELSNAGSWNVLVLYATEWTRREPENAAAWNQLSIGFSNLRQYGDAQDAALQAVKFAPWESIYWRNLGQVRLDLDQPGDALKAFQKAADLNVLDVRSIVETGLLNVRLGHLPEAKLALDRALAADPADSDAQCLRSLLLQPPPPKDVIITSRRLPPADARCRAPSLPEPVAEALPTASPVSKTAPPRRR
jgi:tetratricopeptide (TPR) repeat protein